MTFYTAQKSSPVTGFCAFVRGHALAVFLLLMTSVFCSPASFAQTSLTPTDDAYVDAASPNANFGNNANLRISSPGPNRSSQMIFLKFSLAELAGVSPAEVTRATLKLYVNRVNLGGSVRALEATQAWNEANVTWNNRPGFTCVSVCNGASVSAPNQFVTIDVTPQVQRWLGGATNFGFALLAEASLVAVFDSKESGNGPRLEVALTRIISVNGINGLEGGGSSGHLKIGIANSGVTTEKLADGAVTAQKIAAGAVGTSHLADISVTGAKIAPGAVAGAQLAKGAVGSSHLLNGAVTSDKIASSQVVKNLNGLADNVTLVAGENITITPAGNSLTISATTSGSPPPAGAVPKINPLQIATLRWYEANQSSNSFAVGRNPQGLAFDGANIWVANHNDGTVTKLRAGDGANLGTFAVGERPQGLAFDGDHIWVANTGSATVTKLRASDGANLGNFPVAPPGSNPQQVAFDGVNIWVTNFIGNTVVKLRPSDGSVLATYNLGSGNAGVAFDGTHIWVVHNTGNSVSKLRPSDGAVIGNFPVGTYPESIAFDGANVWVSNAANGTVTKLCVSDGANLGNFPVGTEPRYVAFDGVNIWVANFIGASVAKLRASDGTNLGNFPVGGRANGIAFDGVNIWVTNDANNTVTKR